jgi:hypothetical protein
MTAAGIRHNLATSPTPGECVRCGLGYSAGSGALVSVPRRKARWRCWLSQAYVRRCQSGATDEPARSARPDVARPAALIRPALSGPAVLTRPALRGPAVLIRPALRGPAALAQPATAGWTGTPGPP